MTEEWICKSEWTKEDESANFSALSTRFNDTVVPVAICDSKDFNDQKRITMTMQEFVKHCAESTTSKQIFYLKDWHMVQQFPDFSGYCTPLYFQDDWINEFWDHLNRASEGNKDDYRFVYVGNKGSFTPLHKDVFRSYSWSTNIVGTKLW